MNEHEKGDPQEPEELSEDALGDVSGGASIVKPPASPDVPQV